MGMVLGLVCRTVCLASPGKYLVPYPPQNVNQMSRSGCPAKGGTVRLYLREALVGVRQRQTSPANLIEIAFPLMTMRSKVLRLRTNYHLVVRCYHLTAHQTRLRGKAKVSRP